jgi:hypothetical protein
VKEDVAPDPSHIGLFGAEGIVLEADGLADTSPSSVQAWSRSFLGLGCTGDLPLKKDLTGGRLCARIQTTKAARIRDKFLRQGHYSRKLRKMQTWGVLDGFLLIRPSGCKSGFRIISSWAARDLTRKGDAR